MLALRWAARYFQLFRRETCGASGGRLRAAGRGRRAGQLCLVLANLGAKRRKTTAPSGTASPLPALPGAPLPRHGKRKRHS